MHVFEKERERKNKRETERRRKEKTEEEEEEEGAQASFSRLVSTARLVSSCLLAPRASSAQVCRSRPGKADPARRPSPWQPTESDPWAT